MPEIDRELLLASEAQLSYLIDKITGIRRELSSTFQLAEGMVLDLHKKAQEGMPQRMATEQSRLAIAHWRDEVLKAWEDLVETERNVHGT